MSGNVVVDLSKYLNVYRFSTVLPGNGQKVNFKPISTFQLKELVSFDGDPDEALDNLINSCVIDENFDVRDLSLQDRFFLLVELRKRSKGEDYNINYNCVACKGQVIDTLSLNKLKTKKLENLNYVVKLDDNISVKLKLITRNINLESVRLSNQLVETGKHKQQDRNIDEIILGYLLCITSIITPDGIIDNPEINQVLEIFEQGPASFYDDVVKWFNALDFGVNFNIEIKCPHCKNKDKIEVPLENFFS